jgi:hypothetical protein
MIRRLEWPPNTPLASLKALLQVAVPPDPPIIVQTLVRSFATAPTPPAAAMLAGAPMRFPPEVSESGPGFAVTRRPAIKRPDTGKKLAPQENPFA